MRITVVLALILGSGVSALEYEAKIYELTEQVNVDNLSGIIAGLSGEEPVYIDGQKDSLPCRYASMEGAKKAAYWLSEKFTERGFQAEVVEFNPHPVEGGPLPLGRTREEMDDFRRQLIQSDNPTPMWNVVATYPGNDERQVLVTAHYDAISETQYAYTPGADDNASGVSGVLETARIMAQHDWEHTLRFVLFGGEELGLYGSYDYADKAAEAGDDIIGVINLDMIAYDGWGPPEVDVHCGSYEELGQMYVDIMEVYDLELTHDLHTTTATSRSDHYPFWRKGYPAILLIEDFNDFTPHYHTTNDRINTLDFEYMTDVVKGTVAQAAILAEKIEEPVQVAEEKSIDMCRIKLPSSLIKCNVWIEVTSAHPVKPVVFDASGKKVKVLDKIKGSGLPDKVTLDVSELADGVYWIGFPQEGEMISERFILIR